MATSRHTYIYTHIHTYIHTYIHTHARAQCSHASVGIAQAHPKNALTFLVTLCVGDYLKLAITKNGIKFSSVTRAHC